MGASSSSHHVEGDSRTVKTNYGTLVGRRFVFDGKQVDAFQGVPFAKPPLGRLRFKKPEAPEPWEGIKEAKAFGPRGIQKETYFEKMKYGKTSEDNLYLNIFTPAWEPSDSAGFAVIVFIHGGGFISDGAVKYGDSDICQHLCTKNVVVVTVQYRLGYLGFFSTGDEVCPGNLALWDQTLALKWIQENITYFNGNSQNVTVMGQSAGGVSVDLLSICPASRDLFHKVVPMAGNACCDWSIHNNVVEVCEKFAEEHGIHDVLNSSDMIEKLRELPETVFGLSLMDSIAKAKTTLTPIAPRIDGDFIPKPISELRKEAPAKPMLIGCCAAEGLFMLMGRHSSVSAVMEEIAKLVPEEDYPFTFKNLRRKILLTVLKEEDFDDSAAVVKAHEEILGEVFTYIGVQRTVLETLETHNAPVYFYSFEYFNPKSWGMLSMRMPFKGAAHCTELAYIFGHGIVWNYEFNDEDKKMLEMTTTLWTNFAKYGDPNGKDEDTIRPSSNTTSFKWLPATLEHPQRHLAIALNSEMREKYKESLPLFLIEMKRKRCSQVDEHSV